MKHFPPLPPLRTLLYLKAEGLSLGYFSVAVLNATTKACDFRGIRLCHGGSMAANSGHVGRNRKLRLLNHNHTREANFSRHLGL